MKRRRGEGRKSKREVCWAGAESRKKGRKKREGEGEGGRETGKTAP